MIYTSSHYLLKILRTEVLVQTGNKDVFFIAEFCWVVWFGLDSSAHAQACPAPIRDSHSLKV